MKAPKYPTVRTGWKRREVLVRFSTAVGISALGIPVWNAGCKPDHLKGDGTITDNKESGQSKENTNPEPRSTLEPREEVKPERVVEASQDAASEKPPERRMEPTPEIPSHHDHEPVIEAKVCALTEDNIEGPYYRQNAPWKAQLSDPKEPGTLLTIAGVVYATDCQPLANMVVDIWQANDKGSYDNDGQNDPPNQAFHLRGRMRTNAQGQYEYKTVIPGRYLNGNEYRPAHIHYKVYGTGHQTLTTQLYFAGDPYIKGDAFVRPS